MNPQGPQSRPPGGGPLASQAARGGVAVRRIDAAAIVDAGGTRLAPGAILLEESGSGLGGRARVLAVGRPREVDGHPASEAAGRMSMPGHVLIPGLVNAHTHLDLTHLGPRAFDPAGGFAAWVDMIRGGRETDAALIEASVGRGIELSLRGGVVAVGDVAGAPLGHPQLAPARVLARSPLGGVSFIEFFSIGAAEARARDRVAELLGGIGYPHSPSGNSFPLGLQPHATNTVSSASFLWAVEQAARFNLPLMTHAAESPEERVFVASASGPQRDLLERLGIWTDAIAADLGKGLSPIQHLAPTLAAAKVAGHPFALAHVNDCSDADMAILAATGARVCYCPRASDYFRAHEHFGPHRYQEMLAAGIPVALGTDSIVNLPPDAARTGISTLDEMRFLFRRDGTDPVTLLGMATTHGAGVLGLDPAAFTFNATSPALRGLVALRVSEGATSSPASPEAALRATLLNDHPPELLSIGNGSCQTVI